MGSDNNKGTSINYSSLVVLSLALYFSQYCGLYHCAWGCVGIVLDGTVGCVANKKGTEA